MFFLSLLLFHTPHLIHQQILSVLSSKYIQNLIIFYHLHCYHLGLKHRHLLDGLLHDLLYQSAIAMMILPNNPQMLIAYNIYFACSVVCGLAGMALLQAESQVHILSMNLFILGPAASWGMFSSQQMAGVQEAKLNQASAFKISSSVMSIDVPLDMASHVAMFSGNVVVKYSLLVLGGSTAKSHDEGMHKDSVTGREWKIKNTNPICHAS